MSYKATLVHLPYSPGTTDYTNSVTAGYYGYAIILTMSVCNFIYYGDLWYRRVILGRWSHWGGLLHTWWGVQGGLRPLINYVIWAVVGMFAAMAVVDAPNMYVLLGQVVNVMGFIYAVRTMLIILMMVVSFIGDDPLSIPTFQLQVIKTSSARSTPGATSYAFSESAPLASPRPMKQLMSTTTGSTSSLRRSTFLEALPLTPSLTSDSRSGTPSPRWAWASSSRTLNSSGQRSSSRN